MFPNLLCPLSFGSGEVFHSHFLMIEHYWLRVRLIVKGTVHPRIKNIFFSLLPVVLFIHLHLGVSWRLLEISIVEMSAF